MSDPYALIVTDEDVCSALCDLKHRLKGRISKPHSPLADALDEAVNAFLREHRLDLDPQEFATLPEWRSER